MFLNIFIIRRLSFLTLETFDQISFYFYNTRKTLTCHFLKNQIVEQLFEFAISLFKKYN